MNMPGIACGGIENGFSILDMGTRVVFASIRVSRIEYRSLIIVLIVAQWLKAVTGKYASH